MYEIENFVSKILYGLHSVGVARSSQLFFEKAQLRKPATQARHAANQE